MPRVHHDVCLVHDDLGNGVDGEDAVGQVLDRDLSAGGVGGQRGRGAEGAESEKDTIERHLDYKRHRANQFE